VVNEFICEIGQSLLLISSVGSRGRVKTAVRSAITVIAVIGFSEKDCFVLNERRLYTLCSLYDPTEILSQSVHHTLGRMAYH
jgi:hypothetical protein